MTEEMDRLHRVVIIGSGFGGLFAAKRLKKAPVEVTIIDRTGFHLFQPLLYQVATGILSQGVIAPPIREVLMRQKNAQVLLGEVETIDVEAKTVTHHIGDLETVTPYDSLIVSAGAGQSYFGNDHFEEFAPGLKSIDDAMEMRSRIYNAFEIAEVIGSEPEVDEWMTFVVVGAGATGVEMAGQIRELADRSLRKEFRRIDPTKTRVILADGGDHVLSAFGDRLGDKSKAALEKMGIEVRLGAMVTDMDADSVEFTDKEGNKERINSRVKFWAAGVAASPLAKQLGDQTGADIDRSGRIATLPDMTLPGHEEVFVVGDMAALNDYPGVAQVAMQGGKYAASQIKRRLAGDLDAPPFKYFDKGSMATISRFRAIAKVGKIELTGFIAWLAWLFIHILYLVGFQKQVTTLGHWAVAFVGRSRAERTTTAYQAVGTEELVQKKRVADTELLYEPQIGRPDSPAGHQNAHNGAEPNPEISGSEHAATPKDSQDPG
jgi:NADH dehydrogenase